LFTPRITKQDGLENYLQLQTPVPSAGTANPEQNSLWLNNKIDIIDFNKDQIQ